MYVRVKHLINILFTCKEHDLFTYIGGKWCLRYFEYSCSIGGQFECGVQRVRPITFLLYNSFSRKYRRTTVKTGQNIFANIHKYKLTKIKVSYKETSIWLQNDRTKTICPRYLIKYYWL